ncbi:MAG: endolytic transglycosylase MltG [bacterium]|nr:endolytic transglycosylase MltG [bacterium]
MQIRNKKILAFILIALFLSFLFWFQWANKPACYKDCKQVNFIVNKGEGLISIAGRLKEEKLIRNAVAFRLLLIKEGLNGKIQAGSFTLDPAADSLGIALSLTKGAFDYRVTLLEGWRREEIAEKLATELNKKDSSFIMEEFLNLTSSFEGQLFPDTYLFPEEATAQKVIDVLAKNYKKKTAGLDLSGKDLILASIVDREAKRDVDRPIIAGIFLKRLNQNWPLQADAAVQYAVGSKKCQLSANKIRNSCDWWPKDLSKADIAIKSPYNTYLVGGLPPAPISNPGLSAIKAVLSPVQTDYWYYISDKEGKIHYAKDLAEHQQNIQKYLSTP